MSDDNQVAGPIDVRLLAEILRVFIPYRVMIAHQHDDLKSILGDQLPHQSWYFDAMVISNAYRVLSSGDQPSIERALLDLVHPEIPDVKT